ncbi:MAG TPA: exopolyphosphatase, partial [Janibacter terrae]|nr:exopolyphosphatase [Janibacter terrae]
MRVAAIDCGTNSIRLLVADRDEETGTLSDVLRRIEVVRLGEGVDRTGRIGEEALRRTLAVAAEYAAQCRELAVDPGAVRFVATSASRDADNAADFVAGVQEAFGDLAVTPEVISG